MSTSLGSAGKIYVTYAPFFPGKPGAGAVDVFDSNGTLIKTLIAPQQPGGLLNIPYAMAIAPANFGKFSNALLVGNLQDGRINAFDPNSGAFLGFLADECDKPIEIPGLWDFNFGGGHPNNGKTNELFFVAGPDTYYGDCSARSFWRKTAIPTIGIDHLCSADYCTCQ